MQLSYDPRFNIAYIRFRPKTREPFMELNY